LSESDETQAKHTIIPRDTQIMTNDFGIPLEELNFGILATGEKTMSIESKTVGVFFDIEECQCVA
jgi:hypothetical protein